MNRNDYLKRTAIICLRPIAICYELGGKYIVLGAIIMKDIQYLLPVGSVVLLKSGIKKLMIIGVIPYDKDNPEAVYDYVGVPYPEGFLGEKTNFLFHHEDINDIVFRGYDNPERAAFLDFLGNALSEVPVVSKEETK